MAQTDDGRLAIVWEGYISNEADLRRDVREEIPGGAMADLLLRHWERHGTDAPSRWRGKFAVIVWDEAGPCLRLVRDRVGAEPLFYCTDGTRAAAGSSTASLLALPGIEKRLCHEALHTYLLLCYNPFPATFFDGIIKAEPGHRTDLTASGVTSHSFWAPDFSVVDRRSTLEEHAARIRDLMESAVARQLSSGVVPGAFLSGGMDSSSAVALMRRHVEGPIRTFSFRCRGVSFDESHYARLMSERFRTEHTEVEFPPEAVRRLADAVRHMDEPFCDCGIEVASYLLGEAAAGKVPYILTGDGGDELFGGHPVYIADKAARYVDAMPRPLAAPVMKLFSLLPDSDQKKNLVVKLKRFAESWAFGPALGSHRWRIYYTPSALHWLATPALWHELSAADPLARLRATHDGPPAADLLGRSLRSDWRTVVRFAVRRQDMARVFGVEPRFPFYEADLVDDAARIPSSLKIRGWGETKYIQHRAMEGILPDEIVHRTDKLGHSIPLKNWIRDDPVVGDFLRDLLSNAAISRRGLLNSAAVQTLLSEHTSRRANHAHRLWAIAALELWLTEHLP